MFRIITALFILTALPATAQDLSLSEKLRRGTVMDADAFRTMVDGNTITYSDGQDGQYREYYRPGTDRIVIEWIPDAENAELVCDIGTWYAQDSLICFDWFASGEVCAIWVDYQGEYISEIVENGQMMGSVEVISDITRTPLYCEVGMVQLLTPPDLTPAG